MKEGQRTQCLKLALLLFLLSSQINQKLRTMILFQKLSLWAGGSCLRMPPVVTPMLLSTVSSLESLPTITLPGSCSIKDSQKDNQSVSVQSTPAV